MSTLQAYAAAGYAPIPMQSGHPLVGGVHSGDWRYQPGAEAQFPDDCDVGLMCAARPRSGASGPATLGAVSSTWIAGVRWESHNAILARAIDGIVSKHVGTGPVYVAGNTVTRIFRTEQPFLAPRMPPMHFAGEDWRGLRYTPHRFEILSVSEWIEIVRGGRWVDGSLPERASLPLLAEETAALIVSDVERDFINRRALPWV